MSAQDTSREAYWTTSVSAIDETTVRIRGYALDDIIGKLPFSAATYLLVRGELPTPDQIRVFDAVLTAVLDYGLEKSGTVAARYVYSANPSMPAALAAATLGTGKYTLAPEGTAQFAIDAHARLEASGEDPETVAAAIVDELAARRERIPGLGHPVFRYVDPRGQKLKELAVEAGLWGERASFYETIHEAFKKHSGKDTIPINDVGVMALILVEMGFTPEETTGLAIISTLPGVLAHVSEEARTGRPIRIAPRETVDYDVAPRDLESDWRDAGWQAR